MISGRNLSTAWEIASREAESDLSPEYLQRHSRQTRLKDMAPLARGTSAREVAKRIEEEGANAAAVARVLAMMESFMVVDGWMDGWIDG